MYTLSAGVGQVADAAILVGQGVGGGKVGWWPVCSGFLLLVVEGQVRMGGWPTLLGK